MSENHGPLVPHPDRPHVWVREKVRKVPRHEWVEDSAYPGDWYLAPAEPPTPGFWELVLTWVGIFLSGWLSFLIAHAAMEVALRTVGLQRSALIAASLGAIVGAVGWLAGRGRRG